MERKRGNAEDSWLYIVWHLIQYERQRFPKSESKQAVSSPIGSFPFTITSLNSCHCLQTGSSTLPISDFVQLKIVPRLRRLNEFQRTAHDNQSSSDPGLICYSHIPWNKITESSRYSRASFSSLLNCVHGPFSLACNASSSEPSSFLVTGTGSNLRGDEVLMPLTAILG